MTEEHNRDPLLASMTRRYLDAQNKVAQRQALLVRTRTLLLDLRKTGDCPHRIGERNALLEAIDEVLE